MRAKKDILIASHRGSAGISIVDNTIESFQCALAQQADILEMDISMSVDGELFVIHDGMEPRLFHVLDNVQTMTGQQIRRLEYFNMNAAHTGLQARFSPSLNRLAGEYLAKLTGGRYDKVSLTRQFEALAEEAGGLQPRSVSGLSESAGRPVEAEIRHALCRSYEARNE